MCLAVSLADDIIYCNELSFFKSVFAVYTVLCCWVFFLNKMLYFYTVRSCHDGCFTVLIVNELQSKL
jgi:hypothetical protein